MEQAIVQALQHYAKEIPSAVWGIVLRVLTDFFLSKKRPPAANHQECQVVLPNVGAILVAAGYGLMLGLLFCCLFCPRQSSA